MDHNKKQFFFKGSTMDQRYWTRNSIHQMGYKNLRKKSFFFLSKDQQWDKDIEHKHHSSNLMMFHGYLLLQECILQSDVMIV